MRYISVFSGIEAASVAWGPLGWEPVAFSEIDPFPSAVLAERFPDVPNLGDITEIDWSEIGAVDLVVGGSPCQSFSVAGKREGLAGASGLMFEYIRCVRELRPRWFVWENVPGALSSEGGAAFGQLLTEMDDLGYGLAWRVLDAQFFGVAQRRRRVFLVGSLGDGGAERACEVLFEPESLRGNPPSSREKRKALAAGAEGCAGCAGFKYHQGAGAGNIGYEPEQSPTLTADYHNPAICIQGSMIGRSANAGPQGSGINDGVAFTLNTVDRHAVVAMAVNQRGEVRLDGGDGDTVGAIPASRSGKQVQAVVCMADDNAKAAVDTEMCGSLKVGGSAPIVCMMGDHGKAAVDVDVAGTLTAHDGKGAPIVSECLTPWDVQSRRIHSDSGSWPALYAGEGGGHGYVFTGKGDAKDNRDCGRGRVRREGSSGLHRQGDASCDGDGRDTDEHGGAATTNMMIATGCLNPWDNQTGRAVGDCAAYPTVRCNLAGGNNNASVLTGGVVRRLTPRECERLQGFPDDWTLIEWNGKPAPDGRRYKAIGNSMAVPVMRWIGERIELADVGK